jgi:hypothetical protein
MKVGKIGPKRRSNEFVPPDFINGTIPHNKIPEANNKNWILLFFDHPFSEKNLRLLVL